MPYYEKDSENYDHSHLYDKRRPRRLDAECRVIERAGGNRGLKMQEGLLGDGARVGQAEEQALAIVPRGVHGYREPYAPEIDCGKAQAETYEAYVDYRQRSDAGIHHVRYAEEERICDNAYGQLVVAGYRAHHIAAGDELLRARLYAHADYARQHVEHVEAADIEIYVTVQPRGEYAQGVHAEAHKQPEPELRESVSLAAVLGLVAEGAEYGLLGYEHIQKQKHDYSEEAEVLEQEQRTAVGDAEPFAQNAEEQRAEAAAEDHDQKRQYAYYHYHVPYEEFLFRGLGGQGLLRRLLKVVVCHC